MKSILILMLMVTGFLHGFSQSADEMAIRELLAAQVRAWNKGNINEFMKTYWNNDSLMFIGHGGMTYGYQNTLKNYEKNYGDTSKMGKLFFTLMKIKRLSPDYYFVVGRWFLKRAPGDVGGIYTLLIQKIKNKWLVIADHTS